MNSFNKDQVSQISRNGGTVFWREVPEEILSSGMDFSVIDVETTGLFPEHSDRIVEFAILRLSGEGELLREYVTLINPERDIGPTRIHGISSGDVSNAPTFAEVAGDILDEIRNTVLVAHNVRFDKRFIQTEYGRLGCDLPDIPAVCTLGLSYQFLPHLESRRLVNCCACCGIPLENAHSALDDAYAVAALFRFYLNQMRGKPCSDMLKAKHPLYMQMNTIWPILPKCGRSLRRDQSRSRQSESSSYIISLIERLPLCGINESSAEYLDLLDRVLEDRRISKEEAELLLEVAKDCGLSQQAAIESHQNYLRSLVRVACADGIVSESERLDLIGVTLLLSLDELMLDDMVREEMHAIEVRKCERASAETTEPTAIDINNHEDYPYKYSALTGKSVCFTGESQCCLKGMPITRSISQSLATSAGLIVAKSVTKALDILVVADPDTMSSKAGKARKYGTRIMAETVFWKSIGIVVD